MEQLNFITKIASVIVSSDELLSLAFNACGIGLALLIIYWTGFILYAAYFYLFKSDVVTKTPNEEG
jgi:hypothetical protein